MSATIPFTFRIAYLLGNNIRNLIHSRPKNDSLPTHWPPSKDLTTNCHENQKDISDAISRHSELISANMNILLCLAAYVENDLEALLIAPFAGHSYRDKFSATSAQILRDDLIRLSSFEKYLSYFSKIYDIKPRDILASEQSYSLTLLFSMRNMIIHASALSGQVVHESDRQYLYVDDPFYLEILKTSNSLLGLSPNFYCLPETLLGCNKLVDILVENARTGVMALQQHVDKNWPDLKPECSLPWIYT